MKIAICAYGAWARAEQNPPELIFNNLRPRDGLLRRPTPVEGDKLEAMLRALLIQERPDALIGIGLAAGSSVIQLESTAINLRDYSVPDAAGNQPRGVPILDGPVAYRASLPNAEIVQALLAAEIPARISHAAGTHCCNQMLYLAEHICNENQLDTKCGFVHVPYTHAHIARGDVPEQSSMALATMVDALEITLNCLY